MIHTTNITMCVMAFAMSHQKKCRFIRKTAPVICCSDMINYYSEEFG